MKTKKLFEYKDALIMNINESGFKNKFIAENVGVTAQHLSIVLGDSGELSHELGMKIYEFIRKDRMYFRHFDDDWFLKMPTSYRMLTLLIYNMSKNGFFFYDPFMIETYVGTPGINWEEFITMINKGKIRMRELSDHNVWLVNL